MFLFIQTAHFVNHFHRYIQIHLMFLFIGNRKKQFSHLLKFKYISCSYLSARLILRPVTKQYSNTSHVLIYHKNGDIKTWNNPLFKYISCSYLSNRHSITIRFYGYSNTSHVLIYQFQLPSKGQGLAYSNTSHVLIYPVRAFVRSALCFIQIHLMFLFISNPPILNNQIPQFKYISCSYLSNHFLILQCNLIPIQIHLMFLFIQGKGNAWHTPNVIQIHLMFLFINVNPNSCFCFTCIQIHLMFLFIRR